MSEFNLFREEVINTYGDKKSQENLHDKLAAPTPANLRKYCLIRFAERLSNEDLQVLKDFFNPTNKYADLEKAIDKVDLGRMKSVQKFIMGKTTDPDEDIIKLWAVLIDFEPRPFSKWKEQYRLKNGNVEHRNSEPREISNGLTPGKIINKENGDVLPDEPTNEEIAGDIENVGVEKKHSEEKEISGTDKEEEKDIGEKESSFVKPASFFQPTAPIPPRQNRRIFYQTGAVFAAIGLSIAIYLLPQNQCMCWQEDHYVAVDCGEKILGTVVIALDDDKLKYFEKINRPDTLTKEHVNRVWYSKINNQVEFFTGPGMHPVHDHRSLKAATIHIIASYAQNDTTANDLARD